ncbi:hypothetical protein FPY71_10135 [Aureimonas fodinaquatilis]|uniref:Abortive infection family protein n=1 Tax=Aureimonas fodinaquatilis TaxID=2565783 RepID=A0A5B0DY70_9HYPH|nr:hypothetical protein [Aureimonas fodinaquatilis]KAA0970825.1 hypothetical protein FPY71_10135 [Aureimonas fodinaquatilis]
MTSEPIGQRFSQVYLREPNFLPDSERLRNRLGIIYGIFEDRTLFGNKLESELGVMLSRDHSYTSSWPVILRQLQLRDVLDSITIRWNSISSVYPDRREADRKRFIAQVRRVFVEEQVRYRIDDSAGVHFTQDSEFERSRIATITILGNPRYNSVRQLYEEAFICLDSLPPDGKGAIRHSFFAIEALFRLMFPKALQLNGSEVNKYVRPQSDVKYSEQEAAKNLARKQISSFIDWIDGAHFYRHEPGTEDPAQPPLELAVFMVSQVSGFIRWLVTFDQTEGETPS